ncbi:hypothetical protein ACHAXT_000258 [Thalassiosira profunda]
MKASNCLTTSFQPPSAWKRRERVVGDAALFCRPQGRDDDRRRLMAPQKAPPSTRRSFLSLIAVATATTAPLPPINNPLQQPSLQRPRLPSNFIANAAETVGKDENCNDASCLGVWDGLLADCPHDRARLKGGGAGCVSSQDDTPGIFAEPWDYSDSVPMGKEDAFKDQMDRLILALESTSKQRGDAVEIVLQEGRYLRAIVTDGSSSEKSVTEFYFTEGDETVQFRIGSTSAPASGILARSLSNTERAERIRKSLRYLKVPVLRNRKRTFFFVESDDLDGFGPSSAALGPPEEMSPGEMALEGAMELGFKAARGASGRTRRGSDDADPNLRIDAVEMFPRKKSK